MSRLELFGSAAKRSSGEDIGDFDFLVEFEDRESGGYADAYFGLLEELQTILKKPVDLVVTSAINNPYFLQDIARSRTVIYGA